MGDSIRLSALVPLALLGGCATLPMGMGTPPPAPRTIAFLDGEEFALTAPLPFAIGSSGQTITVPAGFVTDYASVPRSLQWLVGPQGRYSRATILHDYLYWAQLCTRRQADNLLWIVMAQSGVPADKRVLIIDGVRLGGANGWKTNRDEQAKGYGRVVPPGRYDLADTLTWKIARDRLRAGGFTDPPPSYDRSVCALGDRRRVP